ncbi:MAG: DUF3990 domain-containing protein [Planctomycetaceae bacterium]|jgi:hypothetical protein|nr:DUF3990 domain-containing protein [Planctomycetaceae bacterium]
MLLLNKNKIRSRDDIYQSKDEQDIEKGFCTDVMILFHGSNQDFDKIDLAQSKDKRDFGRGFYTTTLREQAESWAQTLYDRNGGEGLFIYEFKAEITDDLQVKKFDGISEEWLDLVVQNRTNGGTQHNFDIVQGAIANDKTMITINRLIEGTYTRSEAMQRLTHSQLNDQVSFHTENAVRKLTLNNKRKIDKDRFTFNGQDITLDILCKIERIVTLLAESRSRSFDDVYNEFALSKTCVKLRNTASKLWTESSEYIIDEYTKELTHPQTNNQ